MSAVSHATEIYVTCLLINSVRRTTLFVHMYIIRNPN